MGTPAFAVPTLEAIVGAGHEVALVVAQPDAPAGRGQELRSPQVIEAARRLGLPTAQPKGVRTGPFPTRFVGLGIDVAVVVAYGRILPQPLLDAPRWGCVNVHASLLPRWRGAAPIAWAIDAGDAVTGVCTQRMVAELDAGPLYDVIETPIQEGETAGSLHDRLSVLAAVVALRTLAGLGTREPVEQVGEVTWAPLLAKADGAIRLTGSAAVAARRVAAMTPWPGGFVMRPDGPLRLLEVAAVSGTAAPGTVLSLDPLVVACGEGALRWDRVLAPGRRPVRGAEWARQVGAKVGERLPGGGDDHVARGPSVG